MHTMMALGAFRFGLETAAYQSLDRSTDYRWASQERIGRHPAMQFIGEGHTDITLPGVIYPEFKGGLAQVDAMRAIAGTGSPQMLIAGTGKVFGRFVIMSVSDVQTIFHRDGVPRKIEFTVSLKTYGADGGFI